MIGGDGLAAIVLWRGSWRLPHPVSSTDAAFAHPHVFAEGKIEIVGTPEGKLAAVHNIWRMDEFVFLHGAWSSSTRTPTVFLMTANSTRSARTVKDSIAEWDFYTSIEIRLAAREDDPAD